MKKSHYVVSLVLNIIIVLCGLWALLDTILGIYPGGDKMGLSVFEFFTEDSNIILIIAAFLVVVSDIMALASKKQICRFVSGFKFVATIAEILTFLVVMCYLLPTTYADKGLMMISWPRMIFVHVVDPILAFVSFAFFEKEPVWNKKPLKALYPLIFVLIYGIAMAILVAKAIGGIKDPYGFIDVTTNPWYFIAGWWGGIIVGTYLVGLLVLLLRGKLTKEPAAEAVPEEKEEEKAAPIEEKKAEEKPAEKPVEKPAEKKPEEKKQVEEKPVEKKAEAKPAAEAKPTEEKKEEEPQVIEDSDDDEAAEEAKEEADEKAAETADPNNYMNRPRVYHISKQDGGQWQVKLATGQKAIKLFATQEEAINYAKGLVKTQGGSIRVHSLKGKMRKE
jgi:hypothetical protein